MMVRNVLIHGYNDEALGVGLILCLYSRIIVIGYLLASMTCLPTGAWLANGVRYCFQLGK